MEIFCVRHGEIANYWPTFYPVQKYHTVTNIRLWKCWFNGQYVNVWEKMAGCCWWNGKLNWVDYISIYMYLKNSAQNLRNPLPIYLFGGWHQCGDDGHPSVLLHCMKTTVNFMRRLTGINILYVAYLKHEHCSQQYSDRHVFVSINWYRQHAVF